MKHSLETREKISRTLKERGIKPNILPSHEQCIANLGHYLYRLGNEPWNKGTKGLQVAWNKGKSHDAIKGERNPNWAGGASYCLDCGQELSRRDRQRCVPCYRLFNKGVNHYKWAGGTDNLLMVKRTSIEYKVWRKKVFERDWFTCQVCGYKGKHIHAHHLELVSDNEELIFDTNNGKTLCIPCHDTVHGRKTHITLGFQLP